MVCSACGDRIGRRLMAEPGIKKAKADFKKSTLKLAFEAEQIPLSGICGILQEMGYNADESGASAASGTRRNISQIAGFALFLLALYLLASHCGLFSLLNIFPEAEAGMGFGMIFMVGLLTSTHCLAMCGGINLSQTALKIQPDKDTLAGLTPTLLYGMGRVTSYTVIGGIVGGMGSVMSFSTGAKGIIQITAGVFMMIMGLSFMNVFSWTRYLVPRLPKFLSAGISGGSRRGPLYVGLANGFMPCGPLQAMQLFALSTGNPLQGALAMLAFALGTLPLTMGMGIAASFLGRRFMGGAIRVGAIMVFFMGFAMLGNGMTLAGFVRPSLSGDGNLIAAVVADGRQTLETNLLPDAYQAIRVQAGIPLTWRIQVDKSALNGCNNRFLIPEFDVEKRLLPGENIVEFTPDKPGIYPYMCWMGMIGSRIVVGDVADTGMTPKFEQSILPDADDEYAQDIPWLN